MRKSRTEQMSTKSPAAEDAESVFPDILALTSHDLLSRSLQTKQVRGMMQESDDFRQDQHSIRQTSRMIQESTHKPTSPLTNCRTDSSVGQIARSLQTTRTGQVARQIGQPLGGFLPIALTGRPSGDDHSPWDRGRGEEGGAAEVLFGRIHIFLLALEDD
ncbi:hypothetical protein BaRGS_00039379 [Batillaria attramentaria]|uniref:Uncharacterized protein n=1 Tax=Batillaria attramentaria TaxID=370345 RepID=A0ABD0J3F3_9CAEN